MSSTGGNFPTWTRTPVGAANDPVGIWTFSNSGNSWTLTINGDNTFSLAAVIVACGANNITYTLTVNSTGTGSSTVGGAGTYAFGTTVNLTAAPYVGFNLGYTFAGWSGDADCSDGSVTMGADKTCTAVFNLIMAPDLMVVDLSGPASAVKGTSIIVNGNVANNGTAASVASYVKFYLSQDGALDPGDVYLGQQYVGPIGAGMSTTANKSLTIPSTVATGNYVINAVADATDTNAEYNEDNNTAAFPITVARSVDLVVSVLNPPASVASGAVAAVANTVANNGLASVSTFGSYVNFYLSTDNVIDAGDAYLGQRYVGALAGGSVSGATTNLTIPGATAPGTYSICASADATNTNAELNETNNESCAPVTVTQP